MTQIRRFSMHQPSTVIAMQSVLAPRQITPADARAFFKYQHVDKVCEALADYLRKEIDDIDKIRIDDDGDIFYVEGYIQFMLTDGQLTELALGMGWRDWVEPNYPPLSNLR